MIAYDHYIKFIPELIDIKKGEGSFLDVVTIEESTMDEIEDKLSYEMSFPSNQGRGLALFSNKAFNDTDDDKLWVFKIEEVVTFFWHSGELKLEYIRYTNFSEALFKYWVLHVVLPTFFIIEGIYDFLHAGGVEVDGKPILFIAPSMGGKSTTTDYFMQQDGHFYAVPSHPHHRPYRNVEDLGFFVENFATTPKAMQTIYALERTANDSEVNIGELLGVEKFKSLRNAKEMHLFFPESVQLSYLGKIAQKVSVFKVTVPHDLERLGEVYNAIVAHSQTLNS